MSNHALCGAGLGLWLLLVVTSWLVVPPTAISLANLMWLNGLAVGGALTLLAAQRSGRPVRTVAGILYDAERAAADR